MLLTLTTLVPHVISIFYTNHGPDRKCGMVATTRACSGCSPWDLWLGRRRRYNSILLKRELLAVDEELVRRSVRTGASPILPCVMLHVTGRTMASPGGEATGPRAAAPSPVRHRSRLGRHHGRRHIGEQPGQFPCSSSAHTHPRPPPRDAGEWRSASRPHNKTRHDNHTSTTHWRFGQL